MSDDVAVSSPNLPENLHAKPFYEMARLIADNVKFSGALVLVSPTGETLSSLQIDSMCNEVVFWSYVKTLVLQKIEDLDGQMRKQGAWR